jgi:hypothetical protein
MDMILSVQKNKTLVSENKNMTGTSSKWKKVHYFLFLWRESVLSLFIKIFFKWFNLYSKANIFYIITIYLFLLIILSFNLYYLGFFFENFEDICNYYLEIKKNK